MNILLHAIRLIIVFMLGWHLGKLISRLEKETAPECNHKLCWTIWKGLSIGLLLLSFGAITLFAYATGRIMIFYFPL